MTRWVARLVRWLDRPLPDVGGHSPSGLRSDPRDMRLPAGPAPGNGLAHPEGWASDSGAAEQPLRGGLFGSAP